MKKLYRVYYNCRDDAPYIWSIDDGDQDHEIVVSEVVAVGCVVQTGGLPAEAAAQVDPRDVPVVWLEIDGVLTMGIIYLTPVLFRV